MKEMTKGSILKTLNKSLVGKWFLLNDRRLKGEKFVKITKFTWYYSNLSFIGVGIYPRRNSVTNQQFSNFESLDRLITIEDENKIKELDVLYEKYKIKELLNDTPHNHFKYAEEPS